MYRRRPVYEQRVQVISLSGHWEDAKVQNGQLAEIRLIIRVLNFSRAGVRKATQWCATVAMITPYHRQPQTDVVAQ